MNAIRRADRVVRRGLALAALLTAAQSALAAPPVVSTVPVDPNDPLQPHDVISGKLTTLKGAVDIASVGSTWTWNPGNGSPSVSGVVMPTATSFAQTDDVGFTPYYAIWIPQTYTGDDGDVFFATLTVTNGAGESDSEIYRMEIRDVTLPVEVNVAIDEALWFMHRNMYRFDGSGTQTGSQNLGAIPMGRWDFQQIGGAFVAPQASVVAAAINSFEANGYLESGPASSPYTDTVGRGMRYIIANLQAPAIAAQTFSRPVGLPDSPDGNGNGLGITVFGTDPPYQLGMLMDAIVASGTPNAVATTGPANVLGRTYQDIVQDMVDWYAMAQSDSASHGGWQYSGFSNTTGAHDNSASGWAAIGLLAAEDIFGVTVPQWVKDRNQVGLELTDTESATADTDGQHGYTNSPGPAWGGFGVTASAMVQMALDDVGATTSLTPDERWIRAENFMRRHFNDAPNGNNFKNYYYAMFNFAKAMRTAVPEEVIVIGANNSVGCGPHGGTPGCGATPAPLDWYLDETSGLARTIVDYQIASGNDIGMFMERGGASATGYHRDHVTPWATQILTRTLFQAGPVSRARATPNPGAADSPIALDGSESFHQDPARSLVSYQWDFDNNGTFDGSGVMVAHSFACPTLPVPCSYPVRLRVTDDNVPARFDDDIVVVEITIPPRPPTADAGGPYLVCINEQFELDGSGSSDVDQGTSESGNPPFDTITSYGWELDSVSPFDFDEASGVNPFTSFAAPGVRDVGLRVADNTALAFPTAAQPNLTDSDFGTVDVVDCGCMGPVSARVKPGKVQLTWAPVPGAASYDIFRSTVGPTQGLSILRANHLTDYATYLDANLTNGQTYYYRVRAMGADGLPLCGSSLPVAATPQADRRARPEQVVVPDVAGQSESEAIDTLVTALLTIGDISRVSDAGVPAGDVIRTLPTAGASVVEGSAVALIISLGPVLVEVPDVIGDPSADAQGAIVAAGLTVGDVTEANDNVVPAGNVISQDPIGGILVVGGGAVDLVISLGPQLFAMPDVVGQTQAAATAAITGAGFALGDVTSINSDTVAAGLVISQDPAAGGAHVLGTAVDLVVSLGPVTAAVPNVLGLTQPAAEAAILAAGFGVGAVDEQNSAVVPLGLVMTQSPGAGTQAVPGSLVGFTLSLGPATVEVPDVVGLTQAAAEAAIATSALTVGAVTEEHSLTTPAGRVISQSPAAGLTVNEGSLVDIVVSLGPVQVQVPNVVGLTQAAAQAAITGASLGVGAVTQQNSLTVPAGDVISQNPTAGTTVDEASLVNIVVSLGPVQVSVPNVVGQTQAIAENAIVGAGLVVGNVTNATSATVPAGSVISQNPAGVTFAPEGSAVDLVISLGPAQVSVPDVVGLAQSAAEAAIVAGDLVVGAVTLANSSTVPSGDAISQNPAAGATVNEGSAVDLVISLGPADVQVPSVVGLSQAAAEGAIVAAGLTVGTVTTASSVTVPAGDVISQNPAGGLFAGFGSAVNIVVSEGFIPGEPAAVELTLSLSIVNAGGSIGVVTSVTDAAGDALPLPPTVNYEITFVPEEVGGTAPVFAGDVLFGGEITTSADTRGVYALRATVEGTSIETSEEFVVLRPAVEAEQKALYSNLAGALATAEERTGNLAAAVNSGSLGAMQFAIDELRAARNSVDLRKMARSVAFAPEGGFAPTPAQLGAAGFPNIAANAQFDATLNAIIAKIDQMSAYLATISPSTATDNVAELTQLNSELTTLLNTLNGLAPNVRGYVQSKSELNVLLGQTIPRHLHATVAAVDKAFKDAGFVVDAQTPQQFYESMMAGLPEGTDPDLYYAQRQEAFFSLGGLSVAVNIQMEIINQVYVPIMIDIAKQLALLAINDLLVDTFLNPADIAAVKTGASLSFHVFGAGGSFLEVDGANPDFAEQNDVFLVGTNAIDAVIDLINAFDPSEIEDLDDVFDFFEGIVDAIGGAVDTYDEAHQPPEDVSFGCFLGSSASDCVVLEYPSGFDSVSDCGFICLPSPVIILYHRLDEGFWASTVESFLPE